ncbi:hypothetical protein ACKVWC_005700 [Pyricularia oryzae]
MFNTWVFQTSPSTTVRYSIHVSRKRQKIGSWKLRSNFREKRSINKNKIKGQNQINCARSFDPKPVRVSRNSSCSPPPAHLLELEQN